MSEIILVRNHCFVYTFWWRMAKVRGFLSPIARYKHWRMSKKYGIQIPLAVNIGYGFYIGHGVGVIINPTAIIGNNVNISQFTTIGAHGKAAEIGDNVYIGPSVCIVNNVKVSSNSSIGAGAVVIKDVPENSTVAGVPAKVLNYDKLGMYINNRWNLKN
ncbi:serine O-acetyltransferase [Sphingobacterium athyrii]|nr:hypothetical protein [Sphingobacterium athyrii]